jgi:hypothetical protein
MSVRRACIVLLFMVVGCGGSPSGSRATAGATPSSTPAVGTASPSSTPVTLAALPLGVVVKDFLVEGGATYSVSLVSIDGRVAATATGAKRRQPAGILVQMPNISTSDSRLYFLDGDSKVVYLRPDGATGLATTISVDSNSAAVFAVSPDDTRIAVAVITFPFPARTRIYVEDLSGGGNHIELFSSSTVIEWPVGWHQGHLVLAVGLNAHPQNAYEGFAWGYRGYHVADASTGNRLATVCDGYDAFAPPVPAGTVCSNGSSYQESDWSGVTRPLPADSGCGGGALSTDGSQVADCQGSQRTVALVALDGSIRSTSYPGTPAGWMDANHLVANSSVVDHSLSVIDTRSMAVTQIQAQGFFAGSIPGGL